MVPNVLGQGCFDLIMIQQNFDLQVKNSNSSKIEQDLILTWIHSIAVQSKTEKNAFSASKFCVEIHAVHFE